jgi:hypothetical protein
MPQLDWSIRIVPTDGGGAAFQPQLSPAVQPGTPLQAQVQDIVTWGNQTTQILQIWVANPGETPTDPASSEFISESIPPGGSSAPQYVVPAGTPVGTTIRYGCLTIPGAQGEIVVADFS